MPRDGDAFVVDVVGRGDTISASKTEFSLPALDSANDRGTIISSRFNLRKRETLTNAGDRETHSSRSRFRETLIHRSRDPTNDGRKWKILGRTNSTDN